jgi:methyl-accepting chemotaxis protein
MGFKFNFKIGTKLALMSGLGILLVAGMMGSSIYSNSQVDNAMSGAARQQAIAISLMEAVAGIRSSQLAARDLQSSDTKDDVKKATDQLDTRSKATTALFEKLIPQFRSVENRERVEKIQSIYGDWLKNAKQVGQMKNDLNGSGVDSARRDEIQDKIDTLVYDRMGGQATQMTDLADKGADVAKDTGDKAVADASDQLNRAGYLSGLVGSVVILLLVGSAIFGLVSIARPLSRLVPELQKLADGDFNVVMPGIHRKDEVGEIAQAAELVAERVGATIVNIKMSASEVTNASAEISTSTTDLSQRTEEQAASLEETSASMEEMTSTVKKNAENAKQASELASSTREVADRGGEVVAKTVQAMAKIEESSRKISDIIIVIDEIARQTNLLALNAAVEAARAGDAGRGFAVVASEVRSLAQRSSQAAKDIKDLITNSTDQVKDGVDLVNRAGQSLNEIVASIKKVTAVVSEIANASMEQSTGIDQINKALNQMDEVTQQNSALVEENAATAKTLEQQAKSMDERVAMFRVRPTSTESAYMPPASEHRAPIAMPRSEAPKRSAAPKRATASRTNGAAHRGPVGRMQAGLAVALNEEADWKEF